ncbi:hypothetical protein [Vibrio sp.]|uniref:hypothetical protein n=1 Tax=Vibrio sp. TaxID=678 RepID=UPI003D0AB608
MMELTKFRAFILTAVAATIGLWASPALSDPFQLDGNAIEADAPPPDDWETLYNGGGSALKFTGIVPDEPDASGTDHSVFTGGRKDIQDLDKWGWKDGSSPDKDEITNAYAAAYKDAVTTNGDLIIYFGADRISNKGDAFLGFWFFKNPVTAEGDGSFNGLHTPGDVLVLTNFPQGTNASPEISVVLWDPTCGKAANNNPSVGQCAAENLRLKQKTNATCGPAGVGTEACAITNDENGPNDPTPSPWPFQSKNSNNADEFPYESLFEGGINISQLIGGSGCFSSFMAESRSSSSFTATLKDFVLRDFNLCSFEVAKECSVVDLNPDNTFKVDYEITVTNTGVGAFTADQTLTIVDNPNDQGDVTDVFSIVGTLGTLAGDASDLDAEEDLVLTGSYDSDVNGGSNTITDATIELDGGELLHATNAPVVVDCDSLELSPLLSINKDCDLLLEAKDDLVALKKTYSVKVCNDGDIPLDVKLSDNKDPAIPSSSPYEFSLDYAQRCDINDANACGADATCTQYTEISTGVFLFACQDDTSGEWVEAVPGGDGICYTYEGEYNPSEVPMDDVLSLTNTANAKATSPIVPGGDLGDLTTIGESDTAKCQLCPCTGENCEE